MSGKMPSVWRSDVDNQLGNLFSRLKNNVNLVKPETTELTFIKHDKIPSVLISTDVIPHELAKKTLDFIKSVPFDDKTRLLNDEDNLPKSLCYYYPGAHIPGEWACRYESNKDFSWEYYKVHMYRLVPSNLRAFYGSPLVDLMNTLLWRWWLNEDIPVKDMIYTTIVLQKISLGGGIGLHDDKSPTRRVSFVYYLTDDDWTEQDGGYLTVVEDEKTITIPPTFNSMVSWQMKDSCSPMHSVSTINSNKNRYALVGFWNDKTI